MPRASGLASAGLLIGLLVGSAHAAPVTYQVDRTIGLGSVVGTIETNGATGVLTGSDILAWDLELNGDGASFHLASGTAGNVVAVAGSDLTATRGTLLFDFSGTDGGYLLFQDGLFSGMHYYCAQASPGGSPCFLGETVVPEAFDSPSAQNAVRTGTQVIASVPEPGALALGGLYLAGMALAMRRRKPQSCSPYCASGV